MTFLYFQIFFCTLSFAQNHFKVSPVNIPDQFQDSSFNQKNQNFNHVMNEVLSINSGKCSIGSNSVTSNPYAAYFSRLSCSFLFSEKPINIFQSHEKNLRGVYSDESNWTPVCSMVDTHDVLNEKPALESPNDDLVIMNKISQRAFEADACNFTKQDRSASEYVNPTQNTNESVVLAENDKINLKKYAEGIKNITATQCCAGNLSCETKIRSVPVSFCKAQKSRDIPDPCIENGDFYQPSDRDAVFDSKKFNPGVGKIILSPFEASNVHETIAHEFGHACSQILRDVKTREEIKINKITDPSFINNEKKPDSETKLDPNQEKIYTLMYSNLNYSKETIDCIINIAHQATKKRFVNGECKNGSESSYIEEAFADYMMYQNISNEDIVPGFLPADTCNTIRDSQHPLARDSFKCALKTPTLLEKMELGVGCKK